MVHLGSNEERVSDAFDARIWISMPDLMKRDSGTNLVCYKLALSRDRTRLTWGFVDGWINRYESFFYDAENKNPSFWTSLFTLLNHGSWGSVLLFTPKSKAVAEVTGAMQTTHLDPLSDYYCWLIFWRHAFTGLSTNAYTYFVETGKQLVSKCRHNPLFL